MRIEDVFTNMPIIQTDRIKLRKIVINDAEDMFEYSSNREVTKYLSYDHKTIDDVIEYIEAKEKKYAFGKCMIWGIEYKEHNKYIGACGFTHWNTEERAAEIAYTISQKYWGKGIATEAVKKLFKFGFEIMNLNTIEARCWADNHKSTRVMEKNNMKFEGILREQLYAKGKYRDIKIYSILKREYENSFLTEI